MTKNILKKIVSLQLGLLKAAFAGISKRNNVLWNIKKVFTPEITTRGKYRNIAMFAEMRTSCSIQGCGKPQEWIVLSPLFFIINRLEPRFATRFINFPSFKNLESLRKKKRVIKYK